MAPGSGATSADHRQPASLGSPDRDALGERALAPGAALGDSISGSVEETPALSGNALAIAAGAAIVEVARKPHHAAEIVAARASVRAETSWRRSRTPTKKDPKRHGAPARAIRLQVQASRRWRRWKAIPIPREMPRNSQRRSDNMKPPAAPRL